MSYSMSVCVSLQLVCSLDGQSEGSVLLGSVTVSILTGGKSRVSQRHSGHIMYRYIVKVKTSVYPRQAILQ